MKLSMVALPLLLLLAAAPRCFAEGDGSVTVPNKDGTTTTYTEGGSKTVTDASGAVASTETGDASAAEAAAAAVGAADAAVLASTQSTSVGGSSTIDTDGTYTITNPEGTGTGSVDGGSYDFQAVDGTRVVVDMNTPASEGSYTVTYPNGTTVSAPVSATVADLLGAAASAGDGHDSFGKNAAAAGSLRWGAVAGALAVLGAAAIF